MVTYDDGILFLREAKKQGMIGPDYVYIGGDGSVVMPDTVLANKTGLYYESDWDNMQGYVGFLPNDVSTNQKFNDLKAW
jgi:hypothetical protein